MGAGSGVDAGSGSGVCSGGPVMGQRRRLALRSVRGAVGKGRDFTRRALRDWGWDGRESAEDALLVVSELVTNAALHAHGCEELVLTAGETLRIEVLDGVTELPCPGAVRRPGVPGGHGLHLVRRLSDRWGCYPAGAGKVVWAEIESSRLTARRRDPNPPPPGPQRPGPGRRGPGRR
ncbi:ATP-binding protein [Streptomyces sp. NPDC058401]|uniref:ATP-binding protein n=1 Tax=Streptomyces sp. NPDC058401 TaxID=3346480 RepID=UPI0036481C27